MESAEKLSNQADRRSKKVEARSTINDRFSSEYLAYLKSPAWQQRRSRIIARDQKCQSCGTKKRLQCDHLRYPRLGSAIAEFNNQPDDDFQMLCEKCHRKKTIDSRKKRDRG